MLPTIQGAQQVARSSLIPTIKSSIAAGVRHVSNSVAPIRNKVAIIGPAGAIGASLLLNAVNAQADDVYAVVRPSRVTEIHEKGISVKHGDTTTVVMPSKHPSLHVVGSLKDVPEGTIVVNTVKNHQLMDSLKDLQPGHELVLIQNGLGHDEQVQKVLPGAKVHKAISYVAARQLPGRGVQTQGGYVQIGAGALAERLKSAFADQSVFEVREVPDITVAQWQKAALNCALNPLATIFGCKMSELSENEDYHTVAKVVLAEVCNVGEKVGVFRPGDNAYSAVYNEFQRLTAKFPDHPTSMQLSFKAGEKTEIPALNAYVAGKGKELGIAVPVNEFIATSMAHFDDVRRGSLNHDQFQLEHGGTLSETGQHLVDLAKHQLRLTEA